MRLVHRLRRKVQAQPGELCEDVACGPGPDEGLWIAVMFIEVAVHGGLQIDDGAEDPSSQAHAGQSGEEFSTALSQELEVGVKWKVQRGWRMSQAWTLGCLWVA